MEPGPRTKQNRRAAFVRAGAASIAFFIPIIVATAYLNMGQTCSCGSTCPPAPPDFRVSKSTGGVGADDASTEGAVTAQGNDIAFTSEADNLDPAAASIPGPHVFVHNISTKATDWVSLAALGEPDAIGSGSPVLSEYGQFIAFEQQFFGIPATHAIIFRDLDAATPSFETIASTGTTPVSDPTMSGDGRYVAFATTAALVPEDTDTASDVYLKDRWMGTLILRSNDAGAVDAVRPKLSRDGQWITYDVDGGFPGLIIIDVARVLGLAALSGDLPSLTDDGSLLVFRRTVGGVDRIFVEPPFGIDPSEEVSIDASGIPTTDDCDNPVISGNGRYVAFRCVQPMTDHGALNQVYVRDLVEQTTKLASITDTGVPANSLDSKPVGMPANGNAVIIESSADNLGDVPVGFPQVFRIPIGYWSEGGSSCSTDDTTCDGVDDDCDGQTDEDYVSQATSCGVGACASTGSTSCVDGAVQDSCIPLSGSPEGTVCNGIDDDCDGVVDEDYVNLPSTCGFGPCESTGLLICQSGIVVDTCSPGVPGATEDTTCDGIDDDCDGTVDEDCVICIPATCQDYNINCGTVDDGCGTMIDCGVCTGDETCGGGGTPNVCGIPLPPDPGTIAPPAPAGAGSFLQSFAFLTEGSNPVQTGVQPGALESHRTGLLRGRVLSHSGQPIPAVQVSVVGDPTLGSTLSRADGAYDLLVNGGGQVTLRFAAVGHLPVQRTIDVPWSNAVELEDVVLTVPGPAATVNGQPQKVIFGSSETQVVKGQAYTNDDGVGTHQVTGFLPAGTGAFVEVDGMSQPIADGTLQVTEYTVGEDGPKAMPGELPENSLYTFAVDISVAEHGPEARVSFTDATGNPTTTYFYVDDFLDSPVGAFVPNGYYDYDLGRWVASTDGLVMKVVGVTPEGLAKIDALADGQETETDPIELETRLGLGAEERAALAQLYADGRKFWRMPIDHLTPWDWNHAGVRLEPPPPEPAPDPFIATGCQPPPPHETARGSILNCPGRDLAEEIPIAGTDFSLRYDSHRSKANVAQGRTAVIQFPPPEQVPDEAVALVLKASVLGRTLVDLELPLPLPPPYDQDPSYTVVWDGLDAYGRPWAGLADLEYSISYRFTPLYRAFLAGSLTLLEAQNSFGGAVCNETDPCCRTGGGGRVVDTFSGRTATQSSLGFRRRIPLGAGGVGPYGFGGWSLSHYHYYDAQKRALIRGDGYVVKEDGLAAFGVVAGLESDGNSNNDLSGGSALKDITHPRHIAVGPDGTVYFSVDLNGDDRIWRMGRDGTLEEVFNDGAPGCEDIRDLAVDDQGRVYAACWRPTERIIRLTEVAAGQWDAILLFGGGGPGAPVWKDGQPLLAGGRIDPISIAFREDGTMFFTAAQFTAYADGTVLEYSDPPSSRLRELIEVLPDGRGRIVEVPAGTGSGGQPLWYETARIARGPDNSLMSFVRDPTQSDTSPGHLIQLFADDSVSVLAEPRRLDGSAKTAPGFDWESLEDFHPTRRYRDFRDITVSRDGDVFLVLAGECFSRAQQLYQISRNGLVRRVKIVGVTEPQISLTGCAADLRTRSEMEAIPVNVGAGADGRVFVSDQFLHRIYALGGSDDTAQSFEIASRDGAEIYSFSLSGLHLSTRDAQTGDELYRFTHDADGRLESITDRDGRITEIRRPDGATIEIAAPGGPDTNAVESVTNLRLNAEAELEQVEDPRGARWAFDYDSPDASLAGQGLLQRMWDPRANEDGLFSGEPSVFSYEPFRVTTTSNPKPGAPWLLKRDTNRVGGYQAMTGTVSRAPLREITARWCDGSRYVTGYANNSTTSTVTRSTPLGRETSYSTTIRNQFAFNLYRTGARPSNVSATTTRPDGWHITRYDPNDEKAGALTWQGGRLDYALQSHPRLGDTVLVPKTSTLTYSEQGTLGAQDHRPEVKQDVSSKLCASTDRQLEGQPCAEWIANGNTYDAAIGFSEPGLERVETTVTPFDASSGPPRLSIVEYVSTPERKVTSTSPEGRTSAYVLDDKSRILRLELPGQVPTTYLYDADGFLDRVIRIKGTKTRVTTFGYDPRGYVSSVQNKVSDTVTDEVTMANDPVGFATETTVPGLLTVESTPDITGALSTLTPDDKPRHQLSYTPLGQLAQYASPAGTLSTDGTCPSGTQCLAYSLDRELEDLTLPDGTLVDYVYDPVKATLSSVNVPGHGTTTFGYDGVGRRTSATAPTGGTMAFAWQSTLPIRSSWSGAHTIAGVTGTFTLDGTVERFYNDFLEVSELHVTGGKSVRLARDRDGLVTSIADVAGVFPTLSLARSPIDGHVTGTTLDTVTTSHVLDVSEATPGFGDLLFTFADAGTTNLYDTAYTYDDRGRIDTWTETVQNGALRTRKFGYDAAGRLVTVHDITGGEPGTLLEEYQYDGNGNRQKALSNYPGAVPLDTEFPSGIRCTGPSGDTAANEQDQLCDYGGFTYAYNARGQLESRSDGAATTTYTYDGLGRLLGVSEPGMDLHYIHDALGRRIGKVRDGNLEKGWLYADALNPIAELDGAGNVRATFIYGTRAHIPDVMVMADGTVYRFITDHLGSVRLVVNAATGEVVQRMDYDAFGRVLSDTNPGFQPFGFAGGLYDDDTGLVRFGARDYDAHSGRWTAKDPVLFGGGDENFYTYVLNDPVNLLDPHGLAWYDHIDTGHDSQFMDHMNSLAGWANGVSFGAGGLIANLIFGSDNPIDKCSEFYRLGLKIGGGTQTIIGSAGVGRFAKLGREIRIGKNIRIAPFGNRTGNPLGRVPHYHRRGPQIGGQTRPGQGIGRHRPWETRPQDRSWWDRF